MKETRELSESMIREAMKDCRLESDRRDAIWESIRGKRADSASRGRRRHMEKIIAAYACVVAVFALSITVGSGLWSKLFSGDQVDNPAGAGGMGVNDPAATEKAIWSDREGVEEFVKLLNNGGDWENDPMNRLESLRDMLDYQYNATYSAENILRIHSTDLEGQDEFQIYQQYGDEPKSWVLLNGETVLPLMWWSPYDGLPSMGVEYPLYGAKFPLVFYDITLAQPRGDGSRDLLVMAYSKKVVYAVDWHSDDTKDYYYEEYDNQVCTYHLNPDTENHRFFDSSLVSNFDYDTGVYDNPYCVFRHKAESERIIDVMYAQQSPEADLTVTGEFSYVNSIGERYGYLKYSDDGGDWNSDYWYFVKEPDPVPEPTTPPESDPTDKPDHDANYYSNQGLILKLTASGDALYVVGAQQVIPGEIVIPESIEGLPVVEIGDNALSYRPITSVVIPESVTTIGKNAFSGCNLTEITIPVSVTSIGKDAFGSCGRLEHITVADGNPVYHAAGDCLIETARKALIAGCINSKIPSDGSVTVIDDSAFSGQDLTSMEIPDCVSVIGARAFYGCYFLTEINIPEGVTEIGADAFTYCRNLKSITIPASVTAIGRTAFAHCPELTDITVAAGNPAYRSIGDGLIEIESKTLIVGPKNGIIPSDADVTKIAEYAFCEYGMRDVIIPEGVTTIAADAFINCNSLRRIVIPASVTSIGRYAFLYSEKLTDIYYAGTKEQWDEIFIDDTNEELLAAAVHFETAELPAKPTTPESEVETQQGIILRLSETGDSYYVFSSGISTSINIEIPASWGGLPVTEIGDAAFEGDGWLKSVTIPDSVTKIGRNAFRYCRNLTSITLPESLQIIGENAFYESELTSVTLPGGLVEIGPQAFCDCKGLTSVRFLCREVVVHIFAFEGCEALSEVYFIGSKEEWENLKDLINNKALTAVENIRFGNEASEPEPEPEPLPPIDPETTPVVEVENEQGLLLRLTDSGDAYIVAGIGSYEGSELAIPDSFDGLPVIRIAPNAFDGCEGLVSVTIPEGILEIGSGAFQKIESLISVTIPSTVRTVGNNAFLGCVNLESVAISEGVLRYGAEVFMDCRSLKTITIPKGAEYIGEWIFDGCDSLTDVYYGGSQEEWAYAAFDVMPPDHATLHFAE